MFYPYQSARKDSGRCRRNNCRKARKKDVPDAFPEKVLKRIETFAPVLRKKYRYQYCEHPRPENVKSEFGRENLNAGSVHLS